ncbi:hypothetical protein D3C78_895500 [compost metagenome]
MFSPMSAEHLRKSKRASSRAYPLPQVQRQLEARAVPVGACAPAKQATRWMAPALPVFAGMPAPTGTA